MSRFSRRGRHAAERWVLPGRVGRRCRALRGRTVTSCADGSALKAAINARSHPRSLSQCDREEHDDDDRHDLEGPTTTGCVAADNRKSMRLFCTRLPYMIDGRCLSNDKSLSSSFQEDGSRHVLYTVYSRAYSISTLYTVYSPRTLCHGLVWYTALYTVYSGIQRYTAVYSIQPYSGIQYTAYTPSLRPHASCGLPRRPPHPVRVGCGRSV